MTALAHDGRLSSPRAMKIAPSEFGDDPAIEADGKRHSADERSRVSIRWLLGTTLTGLSGAVLISAAAYTALDQQTRFAEAPTRAQVAHRDDRDDQIVNPKKGDRILRTIDVIAAKQTFRTATTVKSGDKEVVRTKAFTHVATTLTLSPTSFAEEVPPFNPFKINADPHYVADNLNESDIAPDQAEVSFVTRDLGAFPLEAHVAALTAEEAQAQVVEQSKSTLTVAGKAPSPLPGQTLLSRTVRPAAPDSLALGYAPAASAPTSLSAPFSSIEVRMAPVNVTVAPRMTAQPSQMEEKLAVVKHGEELGDVLVANGVPKPRVAAVLAAFKGRRGEPAHEGQQVKLLFADFDGAGKDMQLARVSIYSDETLDQVVAATDHGTFQQVATTPVVAARPRAAVKPRVSDAEDDANADDDPNAMRLYDSIYETALKQDVPKPIVSELVRVLANDVDLQRGVSGGDSLNLFYDESEEGAGRDSLLFLSLTTRGETYRYYRFQTTDDGLVDYYDENGRSSRKFLVRKPISVGETSRGFGYLLHPILGYYKMHTGVDWAAPIGTPIYAAGNGVIVKAQWDAGYGRRVEIQHANGYITTYNHMSGFARGITEGVRVKQGQTIGFLGSTGLSTGPHLHYEVIVNGHFVDPMRVKLARTREFDGKLLADFRRERERIDQLMSKAPNNPKVAVRK